MKKSSVIMNTAWYFGGTLVSAALGFINTPLLTRILEPKVYAQYGMLIAFTTVLATFIYIGQDEAFVRFFHKRTDTYKEYLWRCVKIPLLVAVMVGLLLLEPSHTLLNWVFESNLPATTCIIIEIYVLAIVAQRFLMLTARMEERAANYAFSNIVTKGGFIVATIFVYQIKKSIPFNEIIVCLLLGVIAALSINLMVVMKVDHRTVEHERGVRTKDLLSFGLPFAFSSTLFFAVPLIEKLVIRNRTSWETLAIYTAATIFVTAMSLVKTAVHSVWVPYVYKNYEQESKFKNVFYNIGISLTALCLLIVAGTILLRRWLVLLFDANYYDAIYIAPAMVCGACFDLLSGIYSIGINITQKTTYHIMIPIIQLLVAVILLYTLLPILGLKATGIAYLISIAMSRMAQMAIALKLFDTGRSNAKMYSLFFTGIFCSLLSSLYNLLTLDILCSVFLTIFTLFVCRNELIQMTRFVKRTVA